MALVRLTCPACGGSLELPGDLAVAHCIYCGNKIFLGQDAAARDRRQRENYVELCDVAMKAGNHAEVIRYCNLLLESDPRNVAAWIDKARSTLLLTIAADSLNITEAMQYLNKAAQVAPGDGRVASARLACATELRRLGSTHYQRWLSTDKGPSANAHLLHAMDCYLAASDCAPDSIPALEDVSRIAQYTEWTGPRLQRVRAKLKVLPPLRARLEAQERLVTLRAELRKALPELEALRSQKGLLASARITLLELKTRLLRADIAEANKAAAYELPSSQAD